MQKIINSNTAKYQPMLTDNLVLDDKPTVNSFNSVTSDGVARAIAGASGEVPAVTESDNGKVLTAVYDEGGAAVEWADAQGGGAEYSAGTGISISAQDEISVDTTVIATKNDLSSYQPTISDLETIRSGASAGATAVQPSQLASVATSGSYNDLSNKPTIPAAQVNADWTASSGVSQILNKPTLATVATSGSYNDLSNKPTIPTVDQSYSASSTNAQSGTAVAGALATVNQVPSSTSADEDKVLTVNSSGTPEWATAQSGSSYTAGDGIDISAQDEISVKAGNGLTIGDYTYEHTGPINLTATPVLNQGSYSAPYIAQLTPELLAKMNSTGGLQVTLNGAYDGAGYPLYIGLATSATSFQTNLSNRVVFGDSLGTSIAAGTTVTFDFAERNGSLSTKSYADVAANVSSYYLVVVWYFSSAGYEMVGNVGQAATSADPITTGTYTGTSTVTVQNAVNLSTPIEVVAAMPANPTSGVLYIVTGS